MSLNIPFELLIKKLALRLQQPLPAGLAHEVMRAKPVGNIIPQVGHRAPPKPGSVLILLYPDGNQVFFPLIQRPKYTGAHSGQVSLPGGKTEVGEDAVTTALREGEEEIGINRSSVNIIGRLSDFFVIPSNFNVSPIVGYMNSKPSFRPDPVEVEQIILGNLADIMKTDAIKSKEILAAGRFNLIAPHFELDTHIVWGATAMMLNEFRQVLLELN